MVLYFLGIRLITSYCSDIHSYYLKSLHLVNKFIFAKILGKINFVIPEKYLKNGAGIKSNY
jgi:hypothetical protein